MNAYEKMRQVVLALDAWVKVVKNNPKDKTAIECAEFVEETIKAAITLPRRNCDVGTAEEQAERFSEFCDRYGRCEDCPIGGIKDRLCTSAWAQMPYEEGGVK